MFHFTGIQQIFKKNKQTKQNKPTTKIKKKQNKNSAPITLDGGKSV